jgi:hypothetical protein
MYFFYYCVTDKKGEEKLVKRIIINLEIELFFLMHCVDFPSLNIKYGG